MKGPHGPSRAGGIDLRALLIPALLVTTFLAGCFAADVQPASVADASSVNVVLAHIDTGINPYARAFRDGSTFAWAHPSTYLAGYPADARALVLSLNETDYATAVKKDAAVWETVERDTMYWIPGTRIVAAISFAAGGTNCPLVDVPPANLASGDCEERIVLDDHGHGTMTASRAAAAEHSLCPTCRIVSIEGPGAAAVRWAADQGWIDVQTNSWLDLVPPPASSRVDGISDAFAYAAERMVTIAASGNGAAYLMGFAPTPTYLLDTAAPGVILVGAHDNGKIAAWSGSPPHVVADGYGGWTALRDSMDAFEPHPLACCTSAAAPYAAGGAAGIVLEARRLLGDVGTGLRNGALAAGKAPSAVTDGPIADGALDLADIRDLLLKTAELPREGPDDGAGHWMGTGTAPDPANPAGNPYCVGCWTLPLTHDSVPAAIIPHVGYGAVDPRSVTAARDALAGRALMPERAAEDAFFAVDAAAREIIYG